VGGCIISRWEYCKDPLKIISFIPSNTQEVQWWEENIIIATKVFLPVKRLQVVLESDLKLLLKPCKQNKFCDSLVYMSRGLALSKRTKQLANWGDYTWPQEGSTHYQLSLFSLHGKAHATCLEITEPKLDDTQYSFKAIALQTKCLLSNKFSRILGVCQRCRHMNFLPQESIWCFPCGKLWTALRECGVDVCLLLTIKLLYSRCVSIIEAKSKSFTWVLDSVTTPLRFCCCMN